MEISGPADATPDENEEAPRLRESLVPLAAALDNLLRELMASPDSVPFLLIVQAGDKAHCLTTVTRSETRVELARELLANIERQAGEEAQRERAAAGVPLQ